MILTCKDFAGQCCVTCHLEMGLNRLQNIIEIFDDGNKIFARVCCTKESQALLRRDGITEPIENK